MTKIQDIAKDIEAEIENAEEEAREVQTRITRLRAARVSLLGGGAPVEARPWRNFSPGILEGDGDGRGPEARAKAPRGEAARMAMLAAIREDGRAEGLRNRAGLTRGTYQGTRDWLTTHGVITLRGSKRGAVYEIAK